MPGLVGLVTALPRELAEPELRRMAGVLGHQSFYELGTWIDESSGVYVGWSALKNSFAGRMPIVNENGQIVLVFSGQETSSTDLAPTLRRRGHVFGDMPAAYLVHWYEEDAAFPAALNGRFHGLVIDRTSGRVMLFNDRYGMHRLYYHDSKDAFYFAAEAKAILAARPELRDVDSRGVGEFLACGCVLENRSIFKRIHIIPPGATWTFINGSVDRRRTYFSPREWQEQQTLDEGSFYGDLREVFSSVLPRYLDAPEGVGMSLSGGLDTRAVMAWQRLPSGALPCYTYSGMFRECEDVRIARKIADACGQSHQVIHVGDEFLSRFAYYAERSIYLTDGAVDLLRCPDLYVSERARAIAPVRLTGLYGDEVLRQIPAFKPVRQTFRSVAPELSGEVLRAQSTYRQLLSTDTLSFSVFLQAPWYLQSTLALEETQLVVRTPFLDDCLVKTVFRAPKAICGNNDIRLRLIADGNPALARIRTDRGFGGHSGIRATAARHVLGLMFKAEYAYDYGMPQWLARLNNMLAALHLEQHFLGRHKVYHFRVWYRDVLSSYVREMLLDPRSLSRPYLVRTAVEHLVDGHLRGWRNHTLELHKLLSLELLHRLFVDVTLSSEMVRQQVVTHGVIEPCRRP